MFSVFLPPSRSEVFIERSAEEPCTIGYHDGFVTRLIFVSWNPKAVAAPPVEPAYDWFSTVICWLIIESVMLPPARVLFSWMTCTTTGMVTVASGATAPVRKLARSRCAAARSASRSRTCLAVRWLGSSLALPPFATRAFACSSAWASAGSAQTPAGAAEKAEAAGTTPTAAVLSSSARVDVATPAVRRVSRLGRSPMGPPLSDGVPGGVSRRFGNVGQTLHPIDAFENAHTLPTLVLDPLQLGEVAGSTARRYRHLAEVARGHLDAQGW